MMSRRMIGVLAITACLAAASRSAAAPQTQQRDTRQPAAAPVGTGSLGGSVTNDDGSRPVRSAIVVLIGMMTGAVKVSSTDADGKFTFANLPADRFIVGASKPPYLSLIAGARRPARSGTPIVLADAQKITNVSIRLPMGAAITGVVVDEKGQPAQAVQVTPYQWRLQGGERTLVAGTGAQTDDRGRYRLFGLQPGEYVVVGQGARAPQPTRTLSVAEVDAALRSGTAPLTPAPSNTARYAPAFFPGTTRVNNAVSIAVAAGEERQNVDFKLEVVQSARADGMVVTSDGQPVPGGVVIFMNTGVSLSRTTYSIRVGPDGRFTTPNVVPGAYLAFSTGTGPLVGQLASAIIEIAGADISGVQLTMGPMLSLSGRLVFRGAASAPPLVGWRAPVRSLTSGASGAPALQVQPTTDAGVFTVTNMFPGPYVIGAPLPVGQTTSGLTWAMESVMVDGRDMTDLPIDITPERMPKDVVVTLSDRFQELSGKITRATGAPAPEHTIVVFPEDKAYWIFGSRRIVTARPGTDGKFVLSGAGPTTLPPGKYLLAAVTDLERDEQFDPAFLAALVPASVPVTLQAGEKKVQDLVIR